MAENETSTTGGVQPKKELKVKDLLHTHEKYDENASEWILLMAMFEGIRKIIQLQLIKKHEREPVESYERRMDELFSLGYTKSIIEIFHFYLFKKPPKRTVGDLKNEKVWEMFSSDADLYGNKMDAVFMESSLYAAVEGHMGILVDKPSSVFQTKAEQYEAKVYPYIAKYFPDAILDWKFERDDNNRPRLAMVKLKDDDDEYRIWYLDQWEVWKLPEDDNGEPDDSNEESKAVFIRGGDNPLEEIPFVWHYNQKSKDHGIGVSDVHEVSRIDLSIVRNLSQIEEVINYAAFPIMRKPMRDASPTDTVTPQQDDEVSVKAVMEYDPEMPESKPDWLPSAAGDAITSMLSTIDKKISEIYRSSNAGGMAATEIQTQAKSGVALKTEFQLLNAKLGSKASNMDIVEMKVVEYFLKWEELWKQYGEEYSVERDRTYDIENLAADLENALTAKTVVISDKFDELVQKQTARQVLPTASEDDLSVIDGEIEKSVKEKPEVPTLPDEGGEDDEFIVAGGKAGATTAEGESGGFPPSGQDQAGGDDE